MRFNQEQSVDISKLLSCSALILSTLTITSLLILTSHSASADTSTSASASVTVAAACTFNAVEDTPHSATISPGTYQDSIGKTTFSIVCNDTEGYSIYAIGYSGSEFGNNKLLANINGSSNSTYDINTGTNTSGSPSSWAMKLTPGTGLTSSNILNGYNNYSIVPNQYVKVANLVPATNSTTNNTSTLESTYAVNIAGTQPAGTYDGKVKYTMVHPATNIPNEPKDCAANQICYWPNANGTVTDSMGDRSASANASVTLWASNFKRDGYGFVGWSDKYDWVVNANDVNGNGTGVNAGYHIYGPNQNITTPSDLATKGLSLYAVWVKSQGPIQDWNGCSVMNVGEVTALTDKRDNDTYAVAKLADGKCWMIENLRLDNTNSDNSTGSLAQGYGASTTYGNFSGLAKPETANFGNSSGTATFNSLYYFNTQEGTASIDISNTSDPYYRMPRFNNNNTNQTATTDNPNTTVSNMTGTNQNIYSYGNYYTWAAAIADASYYSTDNQSVTTTSICPRGWHLPTGGRAYASGSTTGVNVTGDPSTFREFYKLGYSIMGSNTTAYESFANDGYSYYYGVSATNPDGKTAAEAFVSYPNNFIRSGRLSDESLFGRGSEGYYQSSTAIGEYARYVLMADQSRVGPGTLIGSKSYSVSIRCISGP